MTHPLTPREKVRQVIEDALNSAIPEPWEVASHATDRVFAALASGSGDHAELARLAEAATPGPWTNIDALRGEKKSVWVADTAREETERDGVTPSRYGPSRTTICNALASNYSLPSGGYETLDPYPNAAFIAAANPATVLALLAENAALRGAGEIIAQKAENAIQQGFAHIDRATEAERKLAEAEGLLKVASVMFHPGSTVGQDIRIFLSKEAERG